MDGALLDREGNIRQRLHAGITLGDIAEFEESHLRSVEKDPTAR
ncbi:hypothetical protein ACOJBO_24630 [Rhizobium beringeri]